MHVRLDQSSPERLLTRGTHKADTTDLANQVAVAAGSDMGEERRLLRIPDIDNIFHLFWPGPGTAARVVTVGLSVNNDGHGHALQSCIVRVLHQQSTIRTAGVYVPIDGWEQQVAAF